MECTEEASEADDGVTVRSRVLDVAAGMLTAGDLRILELHLDGHSVASIAGMVGRPRPSVSRSLNEKIIRRLRRVLAKDPTLAALAISDSAAVPTSLWAECVLSLPHDTTHGHARRACAAC
jgi:hypothetical protein